MKISDLFDLRYGHSLELNSLVRDEDDGIAFVGRAMSSNGVTARIAPVPGVEPGFAGELTVALGGAGVLFTFVQPEPFYCGRDVMILTPKRVMTDPEKLWWAGAIRANAFRYSYNRQANRTLAGLDVPDAVPVWVTDATFPTGVSREDLVDADPAPLQDPVPFRAPHSFAPVALSQLFTIAKGSRLTRADMQAGPTPYVGSSALNNGITAHINATAVFNAGTITVPYNGSVGYAFVQPEAFCAGDDVHVLSPRSPISVPALLFIATLIRCEAFRYGYGYKWTLRRMEESSVRLPMTADSKPDFDYMDRFMRGVPYSSALPVVANEVAIPSPSRAS